jgi:hypothetical protein
MKRLENKQSEVISIHTNFCMTQLQDTPQSDSKNEFLASIDVDAFQTVVQWELMAVLIFMGNNTCSTWVSRK